MAANQGSTRNTQSQPDEVEPVHDLVSPKQPTRRGTQSTTGSGSPPASIPPGLYSLQIHGNCPRCHHRHRAAAMTIKVSEEHISPLRCEKCDSPWLAVGGANSTSLSLLSTQTIELNATDTDFRSTLVEMVRSLAAVGSPSALATVHEQQSSGGTSREHSVRSNARSASRKDHDRSSVEKEIKPFEHALSTSSGTKSDERNNFSPTTSRSEKALSFILGLKNGLGKRFPAMKKLHLKRLNTHAKPRMSEKQMGKLPIRQPTFSDDHIKQAAPSSSINTASYDHAHINEPEKDEKDTHQKASLEAADRFQCNKERLRIMNHEQRAEWIREQITDSKCRCPRFCRCRRASLRSDGSGPHTQPGPSVPKIPSHFLSQQQRHSAELFGVGGHFEGFNYVHSPGPLTISTTRLSQAATVVSGDSTTLPSRQSMPFLRAPYSQHRQRSSSPRPQSLPVNSVQASRLREQISQDEDERRSSVDSIVTRRAVRSVTGSERHESGRISTSAHTSRPLTNADPTLSTYEHQGLTEQPGHRAEEQHTDSPSTPHIRDPQSSNEGTLRNSHLC